MSGKERTHVKVVDAFTVKKIRLWAWLDRVESPTSLCTHAIM